MAWRRTGDKPLPEAMITQFNGTLYASAGLSEKERGFSINCVMGEHRNELA